MRCYASLALLVLAGCSASEAEQRNTDQSNYLAEASEGEVLVIPLYLERGDKLTKRFARVEGTAARADQSLVDAALDCPNLIMWIDRWSSHWGAIVIPAEKSPIWDGTPPMSDEEAIECIKSRTSETFYVAKGPQGHHTSELTLYESPSELWVTVE